MLSISLRKPILLSFSSSEAQDVLLSVFRDIVPCRPPAPGKPCCRCSRSGKSSWIVVPCFHLVRRRPLSCSRSPLSTGQLGQTGGGGQCTEGLLTFLADFTEWGTRRRGGRNGPNSSLTVAQARSEVERETARSNTRTGWPLSLKAPSFWGRDREGGLHAPVDTRVEVPPLNPDSSFYTPILLLLFPLPNGVGWGGRKAVAMQGRRLPLAHGKGPLLPSPQSHVHSANAGGGMTITLF